MNSYDEKHLKVLKLMAAGDFNALGEADLDEVRTLMVCGYIQVRKVPGKGEVIALHPDGHRYLEHLQQLSDAGQPSIAREQAELVAG